MFTKKILYHYLLYYRLIINLFVLNETIALFYPKKDNGVIKIIFTATLTLNVLMQKSLACSVVAQLLNTIKRN